MLDPISIDIAAGSVQSSTETVAQTLAALTRSDLVPGRPRRRPAGPQGHPNILKLSETSGRFDVKYKLRPFAEIAG